MMNIGSLKMRKVDVFLVLLVLVLATPFIISFFGMDLYPVISNSMLHWYPNSSEVMENNFYMVWENEGYKKSEVDSFPIPGGFAMGDLLITTKSDDLSIGDVVVWRKGNSIVTHRLMEKNESMYGVVADQNPLVNMTEEDYIKWVDAGEVREKVVFAIPKAGIPSLFINCMNNKYCGLSCFFDPVCLQNSLKN